MSGSRTRWCGCTSCSGTPTRSGSLIDPKRAVEITDPTGLQTSFEDVDWDDIAPLLDKALTREADDPATAVLGADAAGIARAADYLSRHYTLIATNPPFLSKGKQSERLQHTFPALCKRGSRSEHGLHSSLWGNHRLSGSLGSFRQTRGDSSLLSKLSGRHSSNRVRR